MEWFVSKEACKTMAWPKGRPRKPKADNGDGVVETIPGSDLIDKTFENIKHSGDPADKKLVAAAYSQENVQQIFEGSDPMSVPKEVLEANRGMRFRFRAIDPKTGNLMKGNHYNGWDRFTSEAYPEGIKYGGDMILCFMPEERAKKINQRSQQESTDLVRGQQENHLDSNEQLQKLGGISQASVKLELGASRGRMTRDGRFKRAFRGYSPDELRDMGRKMAEDRAKNRSYSFPSR